MHTHSSHLQPVPECRIGTFCQDVTVLHPVASCIDNTYDSNDDHNNNNNINTIDDNDNDNENENENDNDENNNNNNNNSNINSSNNNDRHQVRAVQVSFLQTGLFSTSQV